MRLFELAKLKESMTMWVPDAPREMRDEMCWLCDGTGSGGYISKSGRVYDVDEDTLRKRLYDWDKRLEDLQEKKRRANSSLQFLQSFYDANIENHPDLADKMKDSFEEAREKRDKIQRMVDRRIARIEKKIKLVQTLEQIDCRRCEGKGTHPEEVSDAPEMNLSNTNARNLMSALGYEPSSGYTIKPEDIPAIKRRIMELKAREGELEQFTMRGGASQKDFGMVRTKDPETGLDKIERKKGPTMISPEIDIEYLLDKFDRMMPILDYAQKHNQEIHFV